MFIEWFFLEELNEAREPYQPPSELEEIKFEDIPPLLKDLSERHFSDIGKIVETTDEHIQIFFSGTRELSFTMTGYEPVNKEKSIELPTVEVSFTEGDSFEVTGKKMRLETRQMLTRLRDFLKDLSHYKLAVMFSLGDPTQRRGRVYEKVLTASGWLKTQGSILGGVYVPSSLSAALNKATEQFKVAEEEGKVELENRSQELERAVQASRAGGLGQMGALIDKITDSQREMRKKYGNSPIMYSFNRGIKWYWGDKALRPLVKDYVEGVVKEAESIFNSDLPLQDQYDKIYKMYTIFDNEKGLNSITQGLDYWTDGKRALYTMFAKTKMALMSASKRGVTNELKVRANPRF